MRKDRKKTPEAMKVSEAVQSPKAENELCNTCFATAVQDGVCTKCGTSQKEANRNRRALPIGTVIANKYMIGKVLGSGSFGITYLAQDKTLARRVALKEYFPNGLALRQEDRVQVACQHEQDEPAFNLGLTKFFQEGQTLAKFAHTGIVRVYDVLQANGSAYLAMEYVQGQSLKQYVQQRGGRLSEADAMKIMRHVQEAVSAVHGAEVVHRDIKPDNIYITPENRILLLDFGGAQQSQTDQEHGQAAMFAYGYAAPEQYAQDSAQIGPWTDVYAYSATFYKLLTGTTLASAWEREADAQSLDWFQADNVSPQLRDAIDKGLVLQPESRLQSLTAFDALLHDATKTQEGSGRVKSAPPLKSNSLTTAGLASANAEVGAMTSANSSPLRLLAIPVGVFLMGVGAWWTWGSSDSKNLNSVQTIESSAEQIERTTDVGSANSASADSKKSANTLDSGAAKPSQAAADEAVRNQQAKSLEASTSPNSMAANSTKADLKSDATQVKENTTTGKSKIATDVATNKPKAVVAKNGQTASRANKPSQSANKGGSGSGRANAAQPAAANAAPAKGSRQDIIADSY